LDDVGFSHLSNSALVHEDVWGVLAANQLHYGFVVMSSTGSIVFARDPHGSFIRVGGWGSELGDFGSGFDAGRMALRAVFDAHDKRGEICDDLTREILTALQIHSVDQIVPWYYAVRSTEHWRGRIADLAIIVARLAEERDDPVCRSIMTSMALE